ncbi:MAG: hypothetical protein JSS70_00500 [Bacteroidetes bacterium]|nr:hypothetical protein [Bacteroidota bacterium]
MKYLKPGIVCLLVVSICSSVSAQKVIFPNQTAAPQSRLFKDVPDRLPVIASKLQPLLALKKGEFASISLTDKFIFKGTVVNSISKYNNAIQSTVIKSADYPETTLTISKVKKSDGSIVYRGRIISFQHGDCFELKNENGQYTLIKRNFEDMVND